MMVVGLRDFVLVCERIVQDGQACQVGHLGFEPEKQRFFLSWPRRTNNLRKRAFAFETNATRMKNPSP